MGGYWGKLDKKGIINVLDNGLAYVKDGLKEKDADIDKMVAEFSRLHDLLYDRYTTQIVPLSYLVKFEKRAGTIIKILKKLDKWN